MLDLKLRHRLLMADRTGDAAWISAVVVTVMAADPTVMLVEVEAALRDAAAYSYLVADPAGSFHVVVGMPAWKPRSTPPASRRDRTTRRWRVSRL